MSPKKTLFCLVHGDPEESIFGIKYNKNMTVNDLRKVIWEEEVETSEHVKAKDLILYKVNIDLNTQSTQRTALTNPNTDIVDDLGGQVLRPTDKIEKKFPATPANDHIHIIVKLPASPAGTKRKAGEMADDIREIKKDVKGLVKEGSAVNISCVNREDWQRIENYTGLSVCTIEPAVGSNPVRNVPAFGWNDVIERSQKDRYLEHLRKSLQICSINRKLGLIDTTNNNNYLDILSNYLPIKLTGTTDAVIADRSSANAFLSESGVRIVFEFKKEVDRMNVYQAMAELVAADLNSRYPVLAVLTDLQDHWQFFFFDEGKVVVSFTTTRGLAVALLRNDISPNNPVDTGEAEQKLSRRKKLEEILGVPTVN